MVFVPELNDLAEQRLARAGSIPIPGGPDARSRWKSIILGQPGMGGQFEHTGLNVADNLERILGRNDLIDIGFFERMQKVAKAVCRIELGNLYGTGWLINERLLVTNNHVLPSVTDAGDAVIEFGVDRAGGNGTKFKLDPSRLFVTSPESQLDYTIVATRTADEARLIEFGALPLASELVPLLAIGEPLNIVQHPNGEHKQYAVRENDLIAVSTNYIHYRTDTRPGSSGAPVFNNQWSVVALHHSGVPRRVNGKIVTRKGEPWREEMGDDAIDWIANEGVRIDVILRDAQKRLAEPQRKLFGGLFGFREIKEQHIDVRNAAAAAPPPAIVNTTTPSTVVATAVTAGVPSQAGVASVSVVVPLHIQLTVGAPQAAESPAPPAAATPAPAPARAAPRSLDEALERLAGVTPTNYYDSAADEAARDAYYADIDLAANDGERLREALHQQLRDTHRSGISYKQARIDHLYPLVDLVRDGDRIFLRSLYTGDEYTDTEEFVREAFAATERFERELAALRLREADMTSEAFNAAAEALEASAGFNCEHVVPQSWFGKRTPMVSDLHHLFTCDSRCNGRRGNFPLTDFADFPAAGDDERCGKYDDGRFEPRHGKAAAARATLYFLVRYPGVLGNHYAAADIGRLKNWSLADPPGEWERHRNAAIAEIQGNRNPFIDFPDLVTRIDLVGGLR